MTFIVLSPRRFDAGAAAPRAAAVGWGGAGRGGVSQSAITTVDSRAASIKP